MIKWSISVEQPIDAVPAAAWKGSVHHKETTHVANAAWNYASGLENTPLQRDDASLHQWDWGDELLSEHASLLN